ncbi:MAG: molybdopterin molybdenumtransferase MoeA [Clostridiales bacterium]|jgi:molybdopterin molybdotransferase|nr:molybdopterin molybdenumtransferase MoeA [Clostridiales bacterium]
MEFLKVDTVETARAKLFASVKDWIASAETITPKEALGRILAEDIYTSEDIPAFRRSTVDGFAVFSADTAAAGESLPVFLTVKDRIEMGRQAAVDISRGECAEVPTGGMLPGGADAVVMTEYAEPFGEDDIAVYHSAAYGENVVLPGEDVKRGALLLRRGRRILYRDVGALAAAGVTSLRAYAHPRVSILSTGDELITPDLTPRPGQIRDINTSALSALAETHGYTIAGSAVLPDDEAVLQREILKAMENSDIVIVSGGSSKGKKDMTREVIDRISSPGVYTHGMAVKPGKPAILGYDAASRTVLAGLPGHPVSAMMVFELLFGWLRREITGCPMEPAIPARVSRNIASSPGKLTCWPCELEWIGGEYRAEPIFGKSGLITTLTRADGYFVVDRDAEGVKQGEIVLVHLFAKSR